MTLLEEHEAKLAWLETNDKYNYSAYRQFCLDNSFEVMSFVTYALMVEPPKPPEISRGLGDTVAKITHATGLDKLSELYTNITGRDCGCASRQEALNKLVPYGVKEVD